MSVSMVLRVLRVGFDALKTYLPVQGEDIAPSTRTNERRNRSCHFALRISDYNARMLVKIAVRMNVAIKEL
jgi:hypothetical protein